MKCRLLPSLFAAALLLELTGGVASAAACTPTGFKRDTIDLTAAMIVPPGSPVDLTGVNVDATGCNIGIFFGPGTSGSVDSSQVINANYFGIVVAGDNDEAAGSGAASVDVTNNTVSAIHDLPSLSGDQHGVGIYYRACASGASATGTISGNTVSGYQKGGIVVSCSGAAAAISNNTVTGVGPTTLIAQNGIQIGYGATGQVMRNTVTGNSYSGTNYASSAGILVFGGCGYPITTGIQIVKNTLGSATPADGNDIGVALANYDPTCTMPQTMSTNIKVINNTITNEEVTNISGNGNPPGPIYVYQAGISDVGVNDKLINNKIDGFGYTPAGPNTCPPTSAGVLCAIDTSTAAKAKVHANAITP